MPGTDAPAIPMPERIPLKRRVLTASAWSLGGYGISQALRLAGNLILTRLLFPEAFGIMALVQAVIVGLTMMSDVGIEQSIIQNRKGHTAAFVNTAWTAKVLRGALISIVTCALATPFAIFYGEPMLAQLLPVAGLTAVIAGFASTNIASADRDLRIARITLIDIGSAAGGLIITIVLAAIYRSVWSLVIGSLGGAAIRTLASHVWLAGIKNRFLWDRETVRSLSTFGRWIFVSSALTFLAGEGNRLLVGTLLDVRMLAFLTLAMAVVQIPRQFFQQLGGRILFSAYSEVVRERPEELYAVLQKSRLIQIVPYWAICALIVYFGEHLIRIMYDDRYHDAGWMLQILGLGSLVGCITASYGGVLWAKGLVRTSTVLLAIQLVVQVGAIVIGSLINGPTGVIVALGVANWIVYLPHAAVYARHSLWQPRIDLPLLGLSILVVLSVVNLYVPSGTL